MIRVRIYKWAFVAVVVALFSYVLVLAYRSAYGGPWVAAEINVASLVLAALAADILFRCWQSADDQMERAQRAERRRAYEATWSRERTQPLKVVHSSVWRHVPVQPPLRGPGERVPDRFAVNSADLRGSLIAELNRGDSELEDTGEVSRGTP